ncbi:unnamed protein product [Trichobilharzia szidati]|nr:unnamed protein product [Trichobilharzia szidati]
MDKREKEELIQMFKELDTNNDGFLTFEELKSGLEASPDYEEFLQQLMKLMDLNQDGKVSLDEFIKTIDCLLNIL